MRELHGHRRDVRAVAFAPDGKLISGGSDNSVRVWDVATGECLTTIKAKAPVYAVAVSPDGKTIAYAGRHAPRAESNFVHLCDPAGKPTARLEVRVEVNAIQWTGPGQFQYVRRPEPRSIWSVAFSADGQYLAAACRRIGGGGVLDGSGAWYWTIDAGGAASTPVPLAENAYAVAFAPVGSRLAATRYQSVAFHDVPTGPERLTCAFSAMWSPAVAFVPHAELVVVGSNSFLYFANPEKVEKPKRVKTGVRTVSALAASPDGKTVLVGGRPATIEVYDVATRTKTTTYDFGIGGVHALAYAPDGLTFAAAGDTGLVVCDSPGE